MITYSERNLSDEGQHGQRMKRKRAAGCAVEEVLRRVEARVVRNITRSVQIGGRVDATRSRVLTNG